MSEKKKFKIQGSTAKVKSDPISTPIIKRGDEEDIDSTYKWIPFFQDSSNIYVNDLAKRARRSSTHSSIINQKITFAVGKGFVFKIDGVEVDYADLPDDLKEWIAEVNPEGDSLADVFHDWMQSFVITGNCYPHVKKSGDFTALYNEDATTVRKSKDKKRAYISNFWRDIKLGTVPTIDTPVNSDLKFYNRTSQKEYLVHVMRKFPEFNYYGLPDYVGA